MISTPRAPGQSQSQPVKIYNAVYSSVQVYESMVRGIAVMRRRADSYVNATQILKVAGVDKGRRTKILEKEILPGKHEIVQGGYGKYQGTWIPLERGRDIAIQYGVAPLLAPLFDFTPNTGSMNSLPAGNALGNGPPRPLSASSSFSSMGSIPSNLAPPPIMPGSALRLLNQGRAQGLFTPSTSAQRQSVYGSPNPYYQSGTYVQSPFQGPTPTPPPTSSLKRTRSDDTEFTHTPAPSQFSSFQSQLPLEAAADIQMSDSSRPPSAPHVNGGDEPGPSPAKRQRKESSPPQSQQITWQLPKPGSSNGISSPPTQPKSPDLDVHPVRFASKPTLPRSIDQYAPLKDPRRAAIINAICQQDDSIPVLSLLREIAPDVPNPNPGDFDIDCVLDDNGHTALHLAASMARQQIVAALIGNGADIQRGNYLGETPLIRACLSTQAFDTQSFNTLVSSLNSSIRTLDTSRKSILHHLTALAGLKGRAIAARYYLDQIFFWIVHHQGGDFRSIVDLQDEHGDTALNIAARVGNRSLVKTLIDIGANRILPNKLGLRPGDFGVESEELSGGPRAEDLLASLRSGPPLPVQKSQDVIADMTTMIQSLSSDFSAEIKTKQDSLDVTQAHLRAATRELSEQRKQIQAWQSRCGELDQINQRVRNIEKALVDEDQFDWTGRTGKDAGLAFAYRGSGSTMVGLGGGVDISFNVDPEPPMPVGYEVKDLIRLRRMKMWYARVEELVKGRLGGLKGASAEKEFMCKKIVALCTGIPVDKVEEMLENLVIAVESEAQIVDIGRVSGFMQKVRDGVI